jgi:exodeoxyribonuclease-3
LLSYTQSLSPACLLTLLARTVYCVLRHSTRRGNHAANAKSAGYTPEERGAFARLLVAPQSEGGLGLVDTFRSMHPDAACYSYWGYRGGARPKNRGWRIDYMLVSEGAAGQVHDSYIRGDVGGSDHCPVGVVIKGQQP